MIHLAYQNAEIKKVRNTWQRWEKLRCQGKTRVRTDDIDTTYSVRRATCPECLRDWMMETEALMQQVAERIANADE